MPLIFKSVVKCQVDTLNVRYSVLTVMRQSSGQNLLISVRVFSRAENKKQHNYCRL